MAHLNESCNTYEWVISHIWMGHVTHMNESCHTYAWVRTRLSWLMHLCDMTHSYACRDSFMTFVRDSFTWWRNVTSAGRCVCHNFFIRVAWPIRMYDMTFVRESHSWLIVCVITHSYVCRDSFVLLFRDSRIWHIEWNWSSTGRCVWVDTFICVSWPIRMCNMTFVRDSHSWLIRMI